MAASALNRLELDPTTPPPAPDAPSARETCRTGSAAATSAKRGGALAHFRDSTSTAGGVPRPGPSPQHRRAMIPTLSATWVAIAAHRG